MPILLITFLLAACASEVIAPRVLSEQERFEKALQTVKKVRGEQELIQEKNLPSLAKKAQQKARQGDKDSQFFLAFSHLRGLGVPRDYDKALYWFKQAAKQKNDKAYYQLGFMAEKGLGQLPDYRKASAWYKKAIDASQDDASKEDASKEENTAALFRQGLLYESGKGTTKNIDGALSYFYRAADKNYSPALSKLGFIYLNGENVLQNYRTAYAFFLRAGQLGSTEALYQLGVVFLEGRGFDKDKEQAYIWFSIASALGNQQAREKLHNIAKEFSTSDISSLQEKSEEWMAQNLERNE